jgi:hypothetical protein
MRIPAKTNGRPPETSTPNVLICLAERTEQLPMTARQIGILSSWPKHHDGGPTASHQRHERASVRPATVYKYAG